MYIAHCQVIKFYRDLYIGYSPQYRSCMLPFLMEAKISMELPQNNNVTYLSYLFSQLGAYFKLEEKETIYLATAIVNIGNEHASEQAVGYIYNL